MERFSAAGFTSCEIRAVWLNVQVWLDVQGASGLNVQGGGWLKFAGGRLATLVLPQCTGAVSLCALGRVLNDAGPCAR